MLTALDHYRRAAAARHVPVVGNGGPSGITSVGSIAQDALSPTGPLLSLYNNDAFVDFVSHVVLGSVGQLHRLSDHMGASPFPRQRPSACHPVVLPLPLGEK